MRVLRYLAAGLLGSVVGGATGLALSCIFVATPLQKVLGPRYSEFDAFGVIGVTLLSALIACVGATVAAAVSPNRLRATFKTRNLFALIVAPALVALVLTFVISGEWAWLGLIHVSSCLGILAGAGSALLFDRAANKEPIEQMLSTS